MSAEQRTEKGAEKDAPCLCGHRRASHAGSDGPCSVEVVGLGSCACLRFTPITRVTSPTEVRP